MKSRFSTSLIAQICIYLLFCAITVCTGQSGNHCEIKGTVTDIGSGEPVQLVNVYLSGTTFGASTTRTGDYIIEDVPGGFYQLIFQHVGYEIKINPMQLEKKRSYRMNARLQPKIYDGEEIQVFTTEPTEWLKQLEFFTKQFIGESQNADECEILNAEVLNFRVNQDSNEFIAYTDSVVRIKNHSLGYQINLVLGDFLCRNERLSHYLIYPKFENLKPTDEEEKEEWIENRLRTYQGSCKHFLSALARGKLGEEDFYLLEADKIHLLIEGFGQYVKGDSLKLISTPDPLYKKFFFDKYLWVSYLPEQLNPPSVIKFDLNYIMIDTLGNVLTSGSIRRLGGWYKNRVADTLPMEYLPTH